MLCSAVHSLCSVAYYAVQRSTEQRGVAQCSAVQCSAAQCSAVQCSAVQCSAVQCSAVQCSAVQCSAVQCSAVQCSAVQNRACREIIIILIIINTNNNNTTTTNNGLQLNFAKCAVLHYGLNNPNFVYALDNHQIRSVNSTIDLGVLRTNDFTYKTHCNNIVRKANRTCAFILPSFTSRNHLFMTLLFVAYIRPLLEYTSQVWSSINIDLINRVESIRRLFTKRLKAISHLSYSDRLNFLGLQRLETRHLYFDLLFLAKLKHNRLHLTLNDFFVCTSILYSYRFISLRASSPVYNCC